MNENRVESAPYIHRRNAQHRQPFDLLPACNVVRVGHPGWPRRLPMGLHRHDDDAGRVVKEARFLRALINTLGQRGYVAGG